VNENLFAAHNVYGPSDQVLPRGCQNLEDIDSMGFVVQVREKQDTTNPYIVRDLISFNEAAHEIIICIASSGVCDLNLLVTTLYEQFKECARSPWAFQGPAFHHASLWRAKLEAQWTFWQAIDGSVDGAGCTV
jgi:hypothetical protein